jgi:hypothetical protein
MTDDPLVLSKADAKRLCLVFGIVSLAVALVNYLGPISEQFTGRWGWLLAPIHQTFGPSGIAAFFAIIGIVLIAIALRK